jgi:DNA-binding transcriptional LysR family regulator
MDVGIRYGDGRWPDLKSTFLLRDAFFPVCSPALLEGMHPLRGPEDLKHHTLIHDRSIWRLKAHSRRRARGCKLSGDLHRSESKRSGCRMLAVAAQGACRDTSAAGESGH